MGFKFPIDFRPVGENRRQRWTDAGHWADSAQLCIIAGARAHDRSGHRIGSHWTRVVRHVLLLTANLTRSAWRDVTHNASSENRDFGTRFCLGSCL